MKSKDLFAGLALCLATGVLGLKAQDSGKEREWTGTFAVEKGDLTPTGCNPYFILEPGYRLVLAGKEDGPCKLVSYGGSRR